MMVVFYAPHKVKRTRKDCCFHLLHPPCLLKIKTPPPPQLCMGVFCGQNFEREYIDVLLNKLLLCAMIQIRK